MSVWKNRNFTLTPTPGDSKLSASTTTIHVARISFSPGAAAGTVTGNLVDTTPTTVPWLLGWPFVGANIGFSLDYSGNTKQLILPYSASNPAELQLASSTPVDVHIDYLERGDGTGNPPYSVLYDSKAVTINPLADMLVVPVGQTWVVGDIALVGGGTGGTITITHVSSATAKLLDALPFEANERIPVSATTLQAGEKLTAEASQDVYAYFSYTIVA